MEVYSEYNNFRPDNCQMKENCTNLNSVHGKKAIYVEILKMRGFESNFLILWKAWYFHKKGAHSHLMMPAKSFLLSLSQKKSQ